jgi:hypothetical protein
VPVLKFVTGQVVGLGDTGAKISLAASERPIWWNGTLGDQYIQTTNGGIKANRPADPFDFEQYFDTEEGANGMLLTWNGSINQWVNGLGNAV